MKVFYSVSEFRSWENQLPVIFVPTMGALHEGHASLMRAARRPGFASVVSIFVNPTQFGPNEDFSKYPRTLDADLEVCRQHGVDAVLVPEVVDIYPVNDATMVKVGGVAEPYEGAFRPSHFDGVATVVLKLFNIVQPAVACFGQKDLQQCAVIQQMVRDLAVPVSIEVLPTMREDDGLALSSRNRYLSTESRAKAAYLPHVLKECLRSISQGLDVPKILDSSSQALANNGFEVQYLAWIDPLTFEPQAKFDPRFRLVVAAKFEGVRLIDNIGLQDLDLVSIEKA
ncbi:MAG TPA: pantoate--beta-alanine ligase [Fimbriimonadaceae bacterium]|nr:pantoate--beta-alanine ligase [Armatimonadota bacterium]HCM74421.1 pantoate--beta-alanine ligase [Armatimonadota bacterium]HRD30219.1 pantoate--beta-alanine ligase [Fimbriimonadaceae bacterium]HRE94506.1 pantoate--beta-alanine ligase [Fimbriimonadaceae bacterium]HRI73514.1 pantoate--beta-alanine ligase [Fimbriimonadaceae bacterium]